MAVGLIETTIALAESSPEATAVCEIDTGRSFSRGAILAAAIRLADELDALVPPGSTVMLHGPGGAGYWAGLLAILGTGRRLLPVGVETVDADRAALAEAHRVEVVVETDAARATDAAVDGSIARLQVVFEDDPKAGLGAGLGTGLGTGLRVGDAARRLDRGANASLLLRSSGSTGRPAVALREAAALDRVSATLVEVLGLREDDRVLVTVPMQHAYGIEHGVFAPMRAGATVAFKAGFDLMAGAAALLDGTTVFPAVPVTLEAATRVAQDGSRLRLAYTAGAPLPESVATAFETAWGVPVGDLYGMTEVGTITFGPGDDRRDGARAAARPVRGVSIGVIDPEAEDAAAVIRTSGAGELVVRSDAMFTGYLDGVDAPPAPGRRVDGHLRTGDLGEIDDDGRVRITGRAKLQFDVGGLKVNPEEVEAVLSRIAQIREVAVVPVSLSETVTRVMAVIVPEPGMDIGPAGFEIAVRVTGRRHLAPHQRPRIVRIVDELPRSATGKLLRGRLMDGLISADG